MKLDRKLLYKMITEALDESAFQKLMRLIATDYEHAKQAMDLIDFVELSSDEKKQLYQAYVSAIVKGSDNPGRDLKEIDFDFHQVFVDAYGFPPPRSEEFKLWDESPKAPLSLRTTVYGEPSQTAQRVGHDVEFEFWFDYDQDQKIDRMIMEPWFRYETLHGKDGYVTFEKGVIRIDEDEEYSEEISKEKLPGVIRQAMGLPWDADISGWPELPKGQPPAEGSDIEAPVDPPFEGKRTLNRNFLFEVINDVLSEEEEEFDTSMIDDLLKSDDEDFIDQAADLVDTLEGIIPDEKFEKYVSAIADHYVYGNKNLKAIEWLSRNYNVTIEDISGPDYKEELFALIPENPEKLKALRNDMDVFWQWDNAIDKENKRLIVGELATTYRSFNHLFEKNFGATPPAGRLPWVTWGDNLEVAVQNDSTNNNVVRFNAGGNYRPRIEIVNPDAMSGRNPEATWWAYNIQSLHNGNLQIRDRATSGVISHTFNDAEDVNYSIDEMKEKIKELTGIDLNAIN